MGAEKFSPKIYASNTGMKAWTKLKAESRCCPSVHPVPGGRRTFSTGKMEGKEGLLVYGGNSPANDRLDDIFFSSLLMSEKRKCKRRYAVFRNNSAL